MRNLDNLEVLQKAVNDVAALCTCDIQDIHFKQIWETLEEYDLIYDCKNCKHHKVDCDVPMEWHCLPNYPPKFYEDNREKLKNT